MEEVDKGDFSIKPENATPAISAADWPLLLKNYDKREFEKCFLPASTNHPQYSSEATTTLPSPSAAIHTTAT
jgi:hypothetical protein